MTPGALLSELRAAGAVLRVVEGRLEAKRLPPALAPLARAHAAELRGLLAAPPLPGGSLGEGPPTSPPPDWPAWRVEAFEERAAIREYDGGQPRAEAERAALLEAAALPEPPYEDPADLPAPPPEEPPGCPRGYH